MYLACEFFSFPLNYFNRKNANFYIMGSNFFMENSFTAVFEKVDDWYIGYVQELPGANVQEKTLEEARESLREAIELILISNRELTEQQLSGKIVIREQITVKI
jgi:predicted RNase H-like HicB family nuclease